MFLVQLHHEALKNMEGHRLNRMLRPFITCATALRPVRVLRGGAASARNRYNWKAEPYSCFNKYLKRRSHSQDTVEVANIGINH